jgi:tRNA G46 methylase TrmB
MLRTDRIGAYPTAKAMVLDFDAEDWFEIGFGGATLIAQMAPKDLPVT